ncbi:MAG: LytTR family transcriptional regulator [Rhizobiaceae bacterium]|nr:LytTR family transcriptional regulator [Rhizobiaceae bacterium]
MHEKFATDPPLQVTLRELHNYASNWRFWIGFGAVIILITAIGPFGTNTSMDVPTRLVYWLVICLATFFIGAGISILIGISLIDRGIPRWLSWVIGGLIAGIPTGGIAWLINIALFNLNIAEEYTFMQFLSYTAIISLTVAVLIFLIFSNRETTTQSINEPDHSNFFDRLPLHLGKNLLSLEAQDHYLNVKTTKGSQLILLRMGDAQKELGNFPGLRVHRSWWVAKGAIEKVSRSGGRTDLVLNDKSIVPVSRSYLKNLKEAGIK